MILLAEAELLAVRGEPSVVVADAVRAAHATAVRQGTAVMANRVEQTAERLGVGL